ncbi:hypothetical protein A3768_4540 (plasmid) [Ralstonia solanacearum]|nr:hypothetical protein A3768_4540 [Ralstonia solanacearum]
MKFIESCFSQSMNPYLQYAICPSQSMKIRMPLPPPFAIGSCANAVKFIATCPHTNRT